MSFFLASQDALEVMLVSQSVTDSKNRVNWCDPGECRPTEDFTVKTLVINDTYGSCAREIVVLIMEVDTY